MLTFLEVGFGGNLVQGFRVYAWRAVPSLLQIALWVPSFALWPQPFGCPLSMASTWSCQLSLGSIQRSWVFCWSSIASKSLSFSCQGFQGPRRNWKACMVEYWFFVQSIRDKYLLSVLLKLFLRIELPSSVNKVRCSMVLCLPLSCASIEPTLTSGQMLSLTSLSGSLSPSMITNLWTKSVWHRQAV